MLDPFPGRWEVFILTTSPSSKSSPSAGRTQALLRPRFSAATRGNQSEPYGTVSRDVPTRSSLDSGIVSLIVQRPDLEGPQGQPCLAMALQSCSTRQSLPGKPSKVLGVDRKATDCPPSGAFSQISILRVGFWLARNSGEKVPPLRYPASFSNASYPRNSFITGHKQCQSHHPL